jgi:hypothetical protein
VKAITIVSIATVAIAGVFALRSPFDEQHQRRVFVLSSDNVRFSHSRFIWWGTVFGAGFAELGAIISLPLTNDTFISGQPMGRPDLNNWLMTLLPILAWSARGLYKKICTTGMEIGIFYTRFQL